MKNKLNQYTTIVFFLGFIFIFPIINLLSPDKKINEIENKILTQLPRFSISNITDGSFMKNFDNYTADQFPFRTEFIELKNSYNYIIGNREFRDIYIGNDGRLVQKFKISYESLDENLLKTQKLADYVYDKYNIKTTLMIVPTSIDFYKSNLPKYAVTDSVKEAIDYIDSSIDSSNDSLEFYTPYPVLEDSKDDYIYFKTDHHWTQLGAKLAYNDLFQVDDSKEDLDSYKLVSSDFYGTYYSKAILPKLNSDDIYAYLNYNDFSMTMDFSEEYSTLYDSSKLDGKNKYQYFLHGDPGVALIEGNKDLENEILIYKDSFAHNFIPFLTNNYSKIHIVDPRYYKMNIDEYLSNNPQIKEIMIINNIETYNSN